MFITFPEGTRASVVAPWEKGRTDPIIVSRGQTVAVVADPPRTTDIPGWTWCRTAGGQAGWVPKAWAEPTRAGRWRLKRDYSSAELTVAIGEELTVIFSESGFVFCRKADGESGWVPDAILDLSPGGGAMRIEG